MTLHCIYFPDSESLLPNRIIIEPPLKKQGVSSAVLRCSINKQVGGDLVVSSSSVVANGNVLLINPREDIDPIAYTLEHIGWLTQDAYEELQQTAGHWDQLAENSSDTFDPEDSNCEGAVGNDYPSTPTSQESNVEEWD